MQCGRVCWVTTKSWVASWTRTVGHDHTCTHDHMSTLHNHTSTPHMITRPYVHTWPHVRPSLCLFHWCQELDRRVDSRWKSAVRLDILFISFSGKCQEIELLLRVHSFGTIPEWEQQYLEYYQPKEWGTRKRFHLCEELAWELVRGSPRHFTRVFRQKKKVSRARVFCEKNTCFDLFRSSE